MSADHCSVLSIEYLLTRNSSADEKPERNVCIYDDIVHVHVV